MKKRTIISLIYIPFILLISTSLIGCFSTQTASDISIEEMSIDEFNVTLYYPEDWRVGSDSYFQFKAFGFAPNDRPANIEYRGLASGKKDLEGQNKYAEGWYEAIPLNYPEWKYISRSKHEEGNAVVYEFEGTYRVATDTFRKIGKLRFVGDFTHAIYYTTLDENFDLTREFFNDIDNSHNFRESKN